MLRDNIEEDDTWSFDNFEFTINQDNQINQDNKDDESYIDEEDISQHNEFYNYYSSSICKSWIKLLPIKKNNII